MIPVPRARPVVATRHLEELLSSYADRDLGAATLLDCDRHVSICPACRAAADAERRLLSSLRSAATPGLSTRLESALLGLAAQSGSLASTSGSAPLAVMGRSAPAMYRSPARAAMLACFVAGASAAAAWSLSVNGVGLSGSPSLAQLPVSATTAGSPIGNASSGQAASFLSSNHVTGVTGVAGATDVSGSTGPASPFADASIQTTPAVSPWPAVPDRSRRSAQLTHE